jgi:hypothetical protein
MTQRGMPMRGREELIAEKKRQIEELEQQIAQMESGQFRTLSGKDDTTTKSLEDRRALLAKLEWELADLEVRLARATEFP